MSRPRRGLRGRNAPAFPGLGRSALRPGLRLNRPLRGLRKCVRHGVQDAQEGVPGQKAHPRPPRSAAASPRAAAFARRAGFRSAERRDIGPGGRRAASQSCAAGTKRRSAKLRAALQAFRSDPRDRRHPAGIHTGGRLVAMGRLEAGGPPERGSTSPVRPLGNQLQSSGLLCLPYPFILLFFFVFFVPSCFLPLRALRGFARGTAAPPSGSSRRLKSAPRPDRRHLAGIRIGEHFGTHGNRAARN